MKTESIKPGLLLINLILLTLMVSAPCSGQGELDRDLDDGMVAYWPLDGHYQDVIGDHHGTAHGTESIEFLDHEGLGKLITLNGIDQFVEITGGEESAFDFLEGSISVSIRFRVGEKPRQTLIAKGRSNTWRIDKKFNSHAMRFYAGGNFIESPVIDHTEMHHAVVVVDANGQRGMRFYIDGVLVGDEYERDFQDRDGRLMIGNHPEREDSIFNGRIDDIAIWERPLDEREVLAIWNDGIPSPLSSHLPDTDTDGLPDVWEIKHGLPIDPENSDSDPDLDGLDNIDELKRGTAPLDSDTDDDGVVDGVESATGVWNGVGDMGTDPLDPDSDHDGLSDGQENPEIPLDSNRPGTDPNAFDTDGDGLDDLDESLIVVDPDFRVDIQVSSQQVEVVVPGDDNAYYIVYRTPDLKSIYGKPIGMVRGATGSSVSFIDPRYAQGDTFYRVRRIMNENSRDIDLDGIDDVTEMNRPGTHSPLNPALQVDPQDGAAFVDTLTMFDDLSVSGANFLMLTPAEMAKQPRFLKFIVTDEKDAGLQVYFLNSKLHLFHSSFLETTQIPCTECIRVEMVYYPTVQRGTGAFGLFTVRLDRVPFEQMVAIYDVIAASFPVAKGNLALHISDQFRSEYLRGNFNFEDSGVPVIFTRELDRELLVDVAYTGLNQAEAFGRLRIMEPGERPLVQDIALFRAVPNDIPHTAGIITESRQTPLSHVNLRAIQNNSPNAFIRGASSIPEIKALLGKLVYFNITGSGYEIREASQDEVDAFFVDKRPSEPQTPPRELSITEYKNLDDIGFEDANAFGVKAANLAEMKKILSLRENLIPDGFAIPFFYYSAFMAHNGFYDTAQRLIDDPAFQSDFSIREAALEALRKRIRDREMPKWMLDAISELQRTFPVGTSIRCRSSTNNEDLPGFNGAGLYDSFTHRPDEGHLSKTIKQVFASLWNLRAYEEREFYRIDHMAAAMGVLIHESFSDEIANGVPVSKNVLLDVSANVDPRNGLITSTYYINAQVGESLVTNPDDHAIPEEILYQSGERTATYLSRSNLVEGNSRILNLSQVRDLGSQIGRIKTHFRALYGGDRKTFAIEFEFKYTADNELVIKQARPWVD